MDWLGSEGGIHGQDARAVFSLTLRASSRSQTIPHITEERSSTMMILEDFVYVQSPE